LAEPITSQTMTGDAAYRDYALLWWIIAVDARLSNPMRDDRPMPEIDDAADARARYEQKSAELVGRRILDVTYWDVQEFSGQPRVWDYGDWHHAVAGLELVTDQGTTCVLWTSTFGDVGIEAFHEPITTHFVTGPPSVEAWAVVNHPLWEVRRDSVIRGMATWYEPGHRGSCPVAMRLDFDAGPIWFVAAQPAWPDPEADWMFVGGDEVVVVFSSQRMRRMGFTDEAFLAESSSR
jgi:hypothetical protein